MDFVTLASTERIASNGRVVDVFLSVAPAVLLSAGFTCAIAGCLSATCMGIMLAVAAGVAVALGALGSSMTSKKTPFWIALAAAFAALACALLVPSARWGFYACVNAVIAHINSICELYILWWQMLARCVKPCRWQCSPVCLPAHLAGFLPT